MSAEFGSDERGNIHWLSIILIFIITVLFIYFSYKLLDILKNLTREGNKELDVKDIEEFKDLNIIKELGFSLAHIFDLENYSLEIFVQGEEPFTSIRIERDFGFKGTHLLLSIENQRSTVNIGSIVDTYDKEIIMNLNEQECESLNKYFDAEFTLRSAKGYMYFFQNGSMVRTYSVNIKQNQGNLPKRIIFSPKDKVNNTPPILAKKKLLEKNNVCEVNN